MTAEAAPRRRRPALVRAIRIAGNVLLVIGAIAIVWAFVIWRWGDPATGLYTRWQQRALEQELAHVQQRFTPAPAPQSREPSPKALLAERKAAQRAAERLGALTKEGEPLGRLRIRRLKLAMVVVDGTDTASLKRGPGIDRRTALPGERQLVYIAGHRTTYGAPFAHIERLRKGDDIELAMPYGTYVYRVTNWVIVPASDVARLRSRGREEVALQACHPRFSGRERYIVYARPFSGPGIPPPGAS